MARLFYWAVFLACLAPGALLARDTFFDPRALGVNPVETLLHSTGRYTITVLLATLAVTPLRRLTGWNRIQSVRRMVGLWAFFYALSHFLIYVVFNQLGQISAIVEDVIERPFILSGMVALVILLALAVTSPRFMVRRLGRNWARLHRLVYVAAIAGVVHFVWGQKADISEPLLWAYALTVLLGFRVVRAIRRRTVRTASP